MKRRLVVPIIRPVSLSWRASLTALNVARRESVGQHQPSWRLQLVDTAYSVILHNRPERTAFLFGSRDVDRSPERFCTIIDEIISTCHRRWAGRVSPIALFSETGFTDDDWLNLELADPDRIISFSKLSPTLMAEIDRRLGPEELRVIESFESTEPRIDIGMSGHGIEVSGVQAVLKRFPADYVLLFQIGASCPRDVRSFCWRNFGRDDVWSPTVFPTATPYEFSVLSDVQKLTFGMDSTEHVADFLNSLARDRGKQMRITAPCQIGAAADQVPSPGGGLEKAFQVLIGDSPADLLEHWNGVRWKRNWYKPFVHQLWVPDGLARNDAVVRAVAAWSHTNLDAWPGGARTQIELASWSWSREELDRLKPLFQRDGIEVCTVLAAELRRRRNAEDAKAVGFPRSLLKYQEAEIVRLTGTRDKDEWEIPTPEIMTALRTNSGSGSWCADVLIEQSALADSGAHRERWWLLPRKSCTDKVHTIFSRPGRINREGYFSVTFRYDSSRTKRPKLSVQRPGPSCLFDFFFWPQEGRNWGSAHDVRRGRAPGIHPVRYLRPSDKGEYLNGIITLFGDLDGAREITGRKFWRELFQRLANRDRNKDPELAALIGNVITKIVPGARGQDEQVMIAANRVIAHVGQRFASKSVARSEIERRYLEYAEAAGAKQSESQAPAKSVMEQRRRALSHEQMRNQLSWLVHRHILRLGVELECQRCGVRSWVHIDQARQHLACGGCGHEQALPGEPEWHYELNSLALRCVTSNQLAALQSLCHLAAGAAYSFVYSTSVEIFRQNEQKPWHEIDLICIRDGRLIVAEVKDTEVVKGDLEELAEIAETLQADEALLFLPAQFIPHKTVWRDEIVARLAPDRIRFEYVGLEQF